MFCLDIPQYKFINKLNFIYFSTIDKQVLQLILISFVGTDVSVRVSLMWEEASLLIIVVNLPLTFLISF